MTKERRSTVVKKINAKGSLVSLASETFPDAKKNLFGAGFEERLKTRLETAKTLLQASSVGKGYQFRGRTTPLKFREGRGAGAFGNPQ